MSKKLNKAQGEYNKLTIEFIEKTVQLNKINSALRIIRKINYCLPKNKAKKFNAIEEKLQAAQTIQVFNRDSLASVMNEKLAKLKKMSPQGKLENVKD